MRYGKLIFLLLLVPAIMNHVLCQQRLFATYAMNEGLVHNFVRDIFQDSRGFIWIGTWEGLSKYDGHKFTNYTAGNGLSHAVVNDIVETKDGDIYIVSNDGSIDIIKNNEIPQNYIRNDFIINRLCILPNKKIIAATDHNGLYQFEQGKFFKPSQSGPKKNYYAIAPFNDSLFIAQSDFSIDILNYRYELFSGSTEPTAMFAESAIMIDSKKRIWLGTANGLRLLSPFQEKGKAIRFLDLPGDFNFSPVKDQWTRSMIEDDAGNIWIGTSNGLVKIGTDGSREVITEKDRLPANDVTCIFQDREKNIWIGGSLGVAKLITQTNISIYTVENGLLSNNTTLLFPFNNEDFLIGSEKGLQVYDRKKDEFTIVPKDKNYYSGDDPNSSLSVVPEKNKEVLITVFSRNKSDPFFFSPSSSGPYFALRDQKGGFFLPTYAGIEFSRDFKNWQKAVYHNDTRILLIDSKEYLWIGSLEEGLFRIRYDYINDTPRILKQDHYLPGKGIRALYEDSKGYIWVGTRYHGIFRFNPDAIYDSSTLHFDQSTGLTSNRIISIAEDKNGSIWLNFYQGIDKLIPDKNSYRVFNFSLINNFFTNIQAMTIDKGHSLWLTTTQGLVNISDGKMENIKPLTTYITSASLGDSIYRNHNNKKITLDYRHKPVQFEFTAPGFINEKQVLFSYRLAGSNNTEWSQPSNEHLVSYANLQPGSYRFEVRNEGWNGEWGNITSFEFVILPPFWKTWWFMLLLSLAASLLIYILIKRRISQVRKEGELKQKIAETEMSALRAQMNPHFIFNCLNSIDNLIQNNEKEKATTYLAKFAKLIRAILENSKNNAIPCWKDMETLELYLELEELRCDKQFSYKINMDADVLHGDYKVPPLVVQPFVENAIHHGLMNKKESSKELYISVCAENNEIRYVIEDNGVGRDKAAEYKRLNRSFHNSMGMNITMERINLFNGQNGSVKITDLYDEHRKPTGTKVEVCLINRN